MYLSFSTNLDFFSIITITNTDLELVLELTDLLIKSSL